MDVDVEAWIEELLENGTFENKEDVIEFCIYAVKMFCDMLDYIYHDTDGKIRNDLNIPLSKEQWG